MGKFDSDSLKDVVTECPGFQARATARAVTRHYNTCFKPFGITAEQFSLLVGIGAFQGTTLVDLSVSAGADATTLSRSIQNLERRGLVRAEGGRGRAGKRLNLTNAGRRLMVKALPAWRRATAELSHRLGDKKLQSARRSMADLAAAAEASSSAVSKPPNSSQPRGI